jgi:hypothetical protein
MLNYSRGFCYGDFRVGPFGLELPGQRENVEKEMKILNEKMKKKEHDENVEV